MNEQQVHFIEEMYHEYKEKSDMERVGLDDREASIIFYLADEKFARYVNYAASVIEPVGWLEI